ncbi:hypothetical protein BRAO375_3670023 [Bradyrhizobium sp. ORS 375]|nr:hypothetical protein BRAO375_3670023 [Bradyrhizobium sp. ORS 375]
MPGPFTRKGRTRRFIKHVSFVHQIVTGTRWFVPPAQLDIGYIRGLSHSGGGVQGYPARCLGFAATIAQDPSMAPSRVLSAFEAR